MTFFDFLSKQIETSITNEQKEEFKSLNSNLTPYFPFVPKGFTDYKTIVPVYTLMQEFNNSENIMSNTLSEFYQNQLKIGLHNYYKDTSPEPYKILV